MLRRLRQKTSLSPEDRVHRAEVWLKQARNDHDALQRLFRRYKQPGPGYLPRTPEVAVYLLQQTVEKATKALMVAAGYNEETLRKPPYGHDSLRVVLEFFKRPFDVPGFSPTLDVLLKTQPLEVNDAEEARKSIDDLIQKVKGGYAKELAVISPDAVQLIVGLMQTLRKRFVSRVRASLPSRTSLRVDASGVEDSTAADRLWSIATSTIQDNTIPAEQMEASKEVAAQMLSFVAPRLAEGLRDADGQIITIQRNQLLAYAFLPVWGLLSLYLLAALTFPHEASSRYPAPGDAPDDPTKAAKRGMLGTKHYTPKLGIVAQLPELNSLTKLVLQDVKPLLENASVLREAATQDQDAV